MDCKKIGAYIQKKRKAVGLTQNELGDLLGVTGKAVSKWECGAALPDVSLFNDLSKILKIDVSELLIGHDCKKVPIDKKKNILIYRLIIVILILIALALFLGNFFVNNYNKVHVYDLVSERDSFRVEGKLIQIGNDNYLSISDVKHIELNDYFDVYSIEYELYMKNDSLYKVGDVNSIDSELESKFDLVELLSRINVFIKLSNCNFESDDIFDLKIKILDSENKIKSYDIPLKIK